MERKESTYISKSGLLSFLGENAVNRHFKVVNVS